MPSSIRDEDGTSITQTPTPGQADLSDRHHRLGEFGARFNVGFRLDGVKRGLQITFHLLRLIAQLLRMSGHHAVQDHSDQQATGKTAGAGDETSFKDRAEVVVTQQTDDQTRGETGHGGGGGDRTGA